MEHDILLYSAGSTAAIGFALRELRAAGLPITDHPTPEITHLLLDIPSFRGDGLLRSSAGARSLLEALPSRVTVIGGNLHDSALSAYRKIDLLTDPYYLADNAAITAHCALQEAAEKMTVTFDGASVLVIGWGRIGKCLSKLLKNLGADVTVAVRKESDQALLHALGFQALDIAEIAAQADRFQVLFNTVPALLLTESELGQFSSCLKIDLASGCMLPGEDVIHANGLPGRLAPESSGTLIAQSILRILKGE